MSLGNIKDSIVDSDFTEIKKEGNISLRLDLGCGNNKKEGFLGVDFSNECDADIIHNLDIYPYPFEDSTVSEIFCSHFFEHVGSTKNFMEECWRMLQSGGVLDIIVPYYTSLRATQDFTHKNFISENSFLYFNKNWIDQNKLQHYNIDCNFSIDNVRYFYAPEWSTRSVEAQEWARKHYWNVVLDIQVTLRAIK